MSAGTIQINYGNKVWAVPLEDTGWVKWNGENEIQILSDADTDAKRRLSSSLSVSDIILGVCGKMRIERIGIIAGLEFQAMISVKINWLDSTLAIDSSFNLIDPVQGIRQLSSDEKNKLALQELIADLNTTMEEKKKPKKVDGTLRLLYTLDKKPRMKTKFNRLSRNKDLEAPMRESHPEWADEAEIMMEPELMIEPTEDPGGQIRLFYGTNRNRIKHKDINLVYSDERDKLKYGFCDVSIPRGHKKGKVERPFHFWFIDFSEKESNHVVLKTAEECDEALFVQKMNEAIDKNPKRDALLFIHGYNTTFAEAARRTAQIAWDVPFKGISGFFSWPSAGELLGYPHDEANAEWSCSHLETFIEKLLVNTGLEELHIIAHSMGNKILAFSLKNIALKPALSEKLKIIHQIVLGAPDIDKGVFEKDILPVLIAKNVGTRKTLYASDEDKALKASEKFRLGLPRLGQAGDELFVSTGIDTIDATNVDTGFLGHAYMFDTKEVLTDLFSVLENESSPENRPLKKRKLKSMFYWLFPD